ncbi:MAG: ion transporter [Candidatus Gracilibacteria bacterium]|nr:ion transporter [Candidatus Gracilibacteria bacterium]
MFITKLKRFFSFDKEKYDNFLEDEDSKAGRLGNFILDISVIISVIVIILESTSSFVIYEKEIFFTTFIISSLFLLDYIYRFLKAKNKEKFLSSALNFIDLLSFLPFFLSIIFSFFFNFEFLVILRTMRVFRVLRLLRNIPITIGFVQALRNYKDEYKAVLLLFAMIIFVVSTLVYEVESPINPEFSSIGKSLWWGIVTASTVGYGDMYPITSVGKIIGAIVILLGPALLAIIGSITILVFTEVAHTQDKLKKGKLKICNHCNKENVIDANYCVNCGRKFRYKKIEEPTYEV